MLTELFNKAGCLCEPARSGHLRCPLIVRNTSEDVVTGHIVQVFKVINPRWWLPDFLNVSLGAKRFERQYYRRLRIEPWVNQPRFPREFLPWDEGSTQVDCVISWENPPTTVFIEAKYGAEPSASTANGDGRGQYPTDQLIRNIRVGLLGCGYFAADHLFDSTPRDFVFILLTPKPKHHLIEHYRKEALLRKAIPNSSRLLRLPQQPFIGQIDYRQLIQALRSNLRFFHRSERITVEMLTTYLEFKRPRGTIHGDPW